MCSSHPAANLETTPAGTATAWRARRASNSMSRTHCPWRWHPGAASAARATTHNARQTARQPIWEGGMARLDGNTHGHLACSLAAPQSQAPPPRFQPQDLCPQDLPGPQHRCPGAATDAPTHAGDFTHGAATTSPRPALPDLPALRDQSAAPTSNQHTPSSHCQSAIRNRGRRQEAKGP